MILRAEDRQAFIRIERRALDGGDLGFLPLRIDAAGHGFEGHHPSLNVDRATLGEFVRELEVLEASRRGSAQLRAMSPRELRLEVRSTDSAGHMEVRLHIERITYGRVGSHTHAAALAFDIDPSELPSWLRDFRALLETPVA